MTRDLLFWWQPIALLGLEATLVIGLAAVLVRGVRSNLWQRMIWQSSMVALLLLLICEATGLGRRLAEVVPAKSELRKDRKIVVATFPVPAAPTDSAALAGDAAGTRAAQERQIPTKGMPVIWWPGLLWAAGFGLILSGNGCARIFFLLVWIKRRRVTEQSFQRRVDALAQRLGIRQRVRLTEALRLTGPVAFGILRPSICVPPGFSECYTEAQQDAMLAHELAHLTARDPLWYWLADLVAACWWWHPLVWWSRRQLQSASEHAADEASLIVEQGPESLAECLVQMGRHLTRPRGFGWLGIEGSGFRSALGKRVERLLNLTGAELPQTDRTHFWFARLAASAVVLLIAFAGAAWTSKQGLTQQSIPQTIQRSIAELSRSAVTAPDRRLMMAQGTLNPVPKTAPVQSAQIDSGVDAPAYDWTKTGTSDSGNPSTGLPLGPGEPRLYKRSFKVDPNTFIQGLQKALKKSSSSNAPPTSLNEPYSDLIRLLKSAGVNLDPPASLFYIDDGTIYVRAALRDLDLIEDVIQSLNMSPPQLTIDTKFAVIAEDQEGAVDILHLLGLEKNRLGPMPANWVFPGPTLPNERTELTEAKTLATQMNSATSTNPPSAAFINILTPAQFREVVNRLDQQRGADILSAPRITTLSSRRAQIKAVDIKQIVTKLQTDPDGAVRPVTEAFEIGQILDVTSQVQADGFTMRITIIARVHEILGSDARAGQQFQAESPAKAVPATMSVERVATGYAVVWDGQTVVVGAGTIEVDATDKTDASGAPRKIRKTLLVFVTPTIIDPAGNRVHSPDDFPLRNTHIPPQKTSK